MPADDPLATPHALRVARAAPLLRAAVAATLLAGPVAAGAQDLGGLGAMFRPQPRAVPAPAPARSPGGTALPPYQAANRGAAANVAPGGAATGANASMADAAASAPAEPAGPPPAVRVVVTGADRAVAMIDGRIVRLGDRVGDMKVSRIDETGVVLAGDAGLVERLRLAPAARKQAPGSAAATGGVR